jgi:putative SOS response-associated peptidase YedK
LPIAIAVICEQWTNGADVLDTFVMLTTPPNALIARIADRMPAILPRETWPVWLGETDASPADVKALLQTFEDGGAWTMEPQQPTRATRPPKPVRQKAQGELF